MDGVIVDSERHWKGIEPALLESLAPDWKRKSYRRLIGCSIQDIHALLTAEHGLAMGWDDFIAAYDKLADEIYGRKVELLPGFRGLLAALAGAKATVGLASSAPRRWIDLVVGRFGLRPAFAAIVSADELGGRGKPDPGIYLAAARALSAAPADCVAIEDAENGILAAKRAGMLCVALANGFSHEQDLSSADLIVRSLAELTPARLQSLEPAKKTA